jgi:hypothetical protein
MWLLLESQAVLHPVLVISVGEVLSGMCTSRFLSSCCRFGSLDTDSLAIAFQNTEGYCYLRAGQQVSQLQSLNQIRVPDHTSVLGPHIFECLVDFLNFADTLIE